MLIFLIYSLILCWGNVSNSNVNMKFAQIQYFLSQNVGRTKDIMSPLSKSWGDMSPLSPINSVPGYSADSRCQKYILQQLRWSLLWPLAVLGFLLSGYFSTGARV